MKFYVTFGQIHVHSVNGKTFDKDCVAVIEAENHSTAREKAFAAFDGKFFTTYDKEPEMKYFPRGLMNLEGRP